MAETFNLRCECGTTLTVPVSAVGRSAHCNTCGRDFVVPSPGQAVDSGADAQSAGTPGEQGLVHAVTSQKVTYQCAGCGGRLHSVGSLGGAHEYCPSCGTDNQIPGAGALGRSRWPAGIGPRRVCDYCRKCLADPAMSASRRFASVLERKDGLIVRIQKRSGSVCLECAGQLRVMSALLAAGSVVGILATGIAWALVLPDGSGPLHVVMSLVLGLGMGVLCMWAYAHMSAIRLSHYWSGSPSLIRLRRDRWRIRRRGTHTSKSNVSWKNTQTLAEFLSKALTGSYVRVSIELKELPRYWSALARQIAKEYTFLTKDQAPRLVIEALDLECAMCHARYPTRAIGGIISACIARQTAADKTALAVPALTDGTPVAGRCGQCGNRMVVVEFNPGRLVVMEYEDPLLQAAKPAPKRK